MATQCSMNFTESINQQPSVTSQPEEHTPQPDYDFVDQPDQDYFCPISLELLTQPHQTICCGNHISQQAADRLIKERKPCPLCKKENFATHEDLYFKRNSINKLKVYCLYKKNKCKWTGELRDLNQHTTSCPKRPWKCPYCPFQSTHDIGTTDHAPQCDYQPVPCLNHCQVDTVPRCHVEKHLLTCPLQLVDCEFASAGCDVRVPRKDLASHMTESAQQHLMTATLLNLRLTRDIHQKMEDKDQQIIQLQTQLQKLNIKVDTEFQQLDKKVDSKFKTKFQNVDKEFQKVQTKLQELDTKVNHNFQNVFTNFQQLQTKLQELDSKVNSEFQEVNTEFQQLDTSEINTTQATNKVIIQNDLLQNGFMYQEITLTEFSHCQAGGNEGRWESQPFNNTSKEHNFILVVYTNGWSDAQETHLSISLDKQHDISKTEGAAVLQLLNQLGDHRHFIGVEKQFSKQDSYVWLDIKFFPLADLGYNAANNTQYLKDNCLKFRLFLKVQ